MAKIDWLFVEPLHERVTHFGRELSSLPLWREQLICMALSQPRTHGSPM